MFEQLTERFQRVVKNLSGQGQLTEDNIKDTLRDVRMALLEADVALPVVGQFIENVREKALGQEVILKVEPGQAFIKIVHDELVHLMGETNTTLNLQSRPPAIILLAGLQGSGKTTTAAKLARFLKEEQKKSVLLVSADVYRPAAIEQLRVLADEINVNFYPSHHEQSPQEIAKDALGHAKKIQSDVLIVDTAGRLHVDDEMMAEIKMLHQFLDPIETLFVVDSMTGQDAAKTAQAFNQALPLTGVILTKADGDARGGAALSVRQITGKPIKFIGVGEKIENLDPFYPERMASRILGMGDIVSLVEEVQRKVDMQKAEKLAKKFAKTQEFDLEDFRDQLQEMTKMGGLKGVLDKMPNLGQLPQGIEEKFNDKIFARFIAIINSMTPKERRFPEIIRGSRKTRIAKGSGTQPQDIQRLIKQFTQMQKMMKKVSKLDNLKAMMQKFNLPGMPL